MRRGLRSVTRPAVKSLVFLLVVLAIAAGVRYMSFLDQMMVYFPERKLTATPADLGFPFEDVSLTAADGTKLHGWHVPGESRTTLLWLHGNAGNISHRVDNIAMLRRNTGLGAFIIDYRGYGQSEGKPSEKGLYMDAEAALDHMTSDLGLDPGEEIILFGRSLGVGVAGPDFYQVLADLGQLESLASAVEVAKTVRRASHRLCQLGGLVDRVHLHGHLDRCGHPRVDVYHRR